jgi:hypothetical protein
VSPFDATIGYPHKAELRESKEEILYGELVRALSGEGWRCFRLMADPDRHLVGFKLPDDPVLSAVYVLIDRTAGSGTPGAAPNGWTVVGFTAEMDHAASTPDELASQWRAGAIDLFQLPVAGEIRVDHQPTTVRARAYHTIDLEQYVVGREVALGPLVDWSMGQVDALRDFLRGLKP